jgi:hypothetical protein
LFKPKSYSFASNRFKTRAIKDKEIAVKELNALKLKLIEDESRLADYMNRNNASNCSNYQKELTKLRRAKEATETEIKKKQNDIEKKTESVNKPKTLEFIFGINLNNRMADGLFLYNCNRLILMFEHTKLQKVDYDYRGIVGIVNIPYLILEPTHNKQQFQDSNELKQLIGSMTDHMEHYLVEIGELVQAPDSID